MRNNLWNSLSVKYSDDSQDVRQKWYTNPRVDRSNRGWGMGDPR
jgi:hypothetical protein